jgi:hypothetical protein
VQITGVQLEVGKVATPFEHRSYGEELALCQRYYNKFDVGYLVLTAYNSGTKLHGNIYFPVEMRASPSSQIIGTIDRVALSGVTNITTTLVLNSTYGANNSFREVRLNRTSGTVLTDGYAYAVIPTSSAYLEFNSEL